MQRQTYIILRPSQLQGIYKAIAPIGWYQIILLYDRGTCFNILPRFALDSGADGIWTRVLLIASTASNCYATEPSGAGIVHEII